MLLLRRFSAWQRPRHSARLANAAASAAASALVVPAPAAALPPSRRARACAATAAAADQQQQQHQQQHYPPPRNAYVHLPFCRRKCFYCDFPVEAIGGAGASSSSSPSSNPAATSRRAADRIRAYVDLVLREIDATARLLGPQQTFAQAPPLLDTVYFGGGTPSLVPPRMVAEIVSALDARFGVADGAEVTLEADPGTFDAARLREYCAPRGRRTTGKDGGDVGGDGAASAQGVGGGGGGAGVTRLSVGVQAFQDALLEACGRSHSLRDVREAVAVVREALKDEACGLRSWSLDLICGLPGLSREAWAESLAQAVATGAGHVSVYDLQVEEGTPFARWYGKEEEGKEGDSNGGGGGGGGSRSRPAASAASAASAAAASHSSLPDEEAGTAMYEQASEALRAAGYERYELSNYALLRAPGAGGGGNGESGSSPGPRASPHRSAHNQCYWRGVPYLAFGLGAASYVRGVRFSRPRDMRAYERWVASLEEAAAGVVGGVDVAGGGGNGGGNGAGWAPGLPHDAHVETPHERLLDRFMLALRTSDGLDLAALAREHGPGPVLKALPALERARNAGLAELRPCSSDSGLTYDWARLTDPKGLMLSNDVISDVFALLD